ncbi:MAG: hypothetical protein PHG06_00485 [Parabacteroides sp.]|nr:hypothetical protein [Parabacteroides sp.]
MIDFEEMNQLITFIIGIVVAIATAYGTMKAQGNIIYPAAKVEAGKAKIAAGVEQIKQLTENNAIAQDIMSVTGNISAQELGAILTVAKQYSVDGFTALEAQELGSMIVEAAKNN